MSRVALIGMVCLLTAALAGCAEPLAPVPAPSGSGVRTGPTPSSASAAARSSTTPPVPMTPAGLEDPREKEIAMELVSSAENSSLDWRAQFAYIEDIHDGRGYTGGIIGFCSGTDDMLDVVRATVAVEPGSPLARFLPALEHVDGTASHAGLGAAFVAAWKKSAADPVFQQAQQDERDRQYFDPAVGQARRDGLGTLGQFIYYDAYVMHGPGNDPSSFGGIRFAALGHARTPAHGGSETRYLNAFLDARTAAMLTEAAHDDTSRVDDEQRVFLRQGDLTLVPPLRWKTYGDPWSVLTMPRAA